MAGSARQVQNTCIHKQCVRYVKITHEQHHSPAEFNRTRLLLPIALALILRPRWHSGGWPLQPGPRRLTSLAPEVSALSGICRTSVTICCSPPCGIPIRIGEARTLTPNRSIRMACGLCTGAVGENTEPRASTKDEVRLVPLMDVSFVRQMESWMVTTRPRRREPLWPVTDETMRNWLKQAVKRAEADGVHFRFR